MHWLKELFSGAPSPGKADEWAAMQTRAATVAALLLCILVSLIAGMRAARNSAGTILVLSTALAAIGYIVGLLFAVPRVFGGSIQTNTENAPNSARDGRRLSINTNLEQISDWLTKIIVGVGLVEAQRIGAFLLRSATVLGDGLAAQQPGLSNKGAFTLALATILAYPSLGFLLGFFSVRLYISRAIRVADESVTRSIDATSILDKAANQVPTLAPEYSQAASETTRPLSPLRELRAAADRTASRLPADPDAILQLTAVCFSVQRELQRLCVIAGLIKAVEHVEYQGLLNRLQRAGLIEPNLADSLQQIYTFVTSAVHGKSVPRDEADDIRVSGQRLIDDLHALPQHQQWFTRALICRAKQKGADVASFESHETDADFFANGCPIAIKTVSAPPVESLKNTFRAYNMVVVLSRQPTGDGMARAQTLGLAWLDDNVFRGTRLAFDLAPWLVDAVLSQ